MNKALLIFLIFSAINLFTNEKDITYNFRQTQKFTVNNNFSSNNFIFTNDDLTFFETKEKIKIFDKPDLSWIKEKNRLEKLFIGIGVVSFTIGFSMFLAGLLNLVVPFDAVSVDGVAIEKVQNTYIAVLSTGAGLMTAGIPFIIVGSVRLGIQKKKDKNKEPAVDDPK